MYRRILCAAVWTFALSQVVVPAADAADLNICELLPVETVNALTHLSLAGTRSDLSPEAHSAGCAYGQGGLVSVSVIRPGGAAALSGTSSRIKPLEPVSGLGDKAFYSSEVGTMAQFGDTAIAAFLPKGNLTDAQVKAMETSLIEAIKKKL